MFRRRMPPEVDAVTADFARGEKVRAWATGPALRSGEPTVVVATGDALYAPGIIDRIPWESIVRASWEEPLLEVIAVVAGATRPIRITLDAPGSVPQVVNERVTATIVMQRHIELVGKSGASLVARRVANSDEIRWEVVFDAGLDPNDPVLREEADQQLAWLRESVGI